MEPAHKPPRPTLATGSREANHRSARGPRRTRLPLYVLAVLLLTAVVVLIWLDLRAAYRDTLAYWDSDLSNTADEQVSVETLWLIERRTDTEGIAHNASTVRLLLKGASSGNFTQMRQGVRQAVQRMARINGFVGGAVEDRGCQLVVETGLPAEAMAGIQEACRWAQASGDFRIVASGMQSPHLRLNLAFPVFAAAGTSRLHQESRRELGAVVMLAEPWQSVFRFFWKGSGPKRPAGTLIVWKDGRKAWAFSPHISDRGKGSVVRLPLNGPSFESLVAREGKVQFGEFMDYRGIRVFAVARPIALAGASVARKVDTDQALAEFHKRALLEGLAGLLSILLLGSVIVAQRRHEATRDLKEKLKQQQTLLDLKRHVEASEEALRQSDQRYKDFISHSNEGVWRVELEPPIPVDLPEEETVQRILQNAYFAECNVAHARTVGFSNPEEVVGKRLGDLLPPPDSDPERIESFRSAARGRWRNRTIEFRGLDHQGNTRILLRTEIPIVESGMLVRVWGITRDVTALRLAEESRRESEERFRTTFENAGIGMAIVDTQGRPIKCNPALQRMLGYSEEELGCMIFTEFTHPDDRELDTGLYRELTAGKRDKYEIEKRYIRKDGQVVWGLLNVSLVKETNGTAKYAVGMVEDITERRRAAEDLQRSFEQLRALAGRLQSVREEERKTIAREIHDELGQALTAIKIDLSSLSLDLAATGDEGPAKTKSILQLVDDTIQSVRRISAELRPGLLDDLGLVAAVEWAVEEFEARTGTKGHLTLPPDDIVIPAEYATAVFRILQETLTNVARHADASEVSVRLAREDGDLCLEVRDNGIGIGEEHLSAGSSLGILGMRERAVLLGGELIIRGIPSGGTTVRVRIPERHRS